MVGSVGMARGVARPNSLIIQEALNLLSALGGDKEGSTKKLLMEMKSVQDHNETVIVDAKAELVRFNQRETEINEREAELSRELRAADDIYRGHLLKTSNGEKELRRKVDQAAVKLSEETREISLREDKLRADKKLYQETIDADKRVLAERERGLREDKEALKEFDSSLKNREEEIQRDRETQGKRSMSLDSFKSELENRDARLLAAMEGKVVV